TSAASARASDLLSRFGVNVNGIPGGGVPPLAYILGWMRPDDISGAKWLLEHGADPNLAWAQSGETPLHVAAQPLEGGRGEGVRKMGVRFGNWLTAEQGQALWHAPGHRRLKGKGDRALLALLLACGLRRHEAVALRLDHLQQREDHWAIVDLMGKGGHVRTVPVPDWVRNAMNDWLVAAAIDRGKLFRWVNKVGRAWGEGITEKAVWHIVKESAKTVGIAKLAPHDLRRTCARLCYASGGELEQIQFLLGHISVQTIERYLGCKQRIRSAVNDRIGIEPET